MNAGRPALAPPKTTNLLPKLSHWAGTLVLVVAPQSVQTNSTKVSFPRSDLATVLIAMGLIFAHWGQFTIGIWGSALADNMAFGSGIGDAS